MEMKTITHDEMDQALPMALADVIEAHHVTQEQVAAALISLLAFTMEEAELKELALIYDGAHSYRKLSVVIVDMPNDTSTGVRLQ